MSKIDALLITPPSRLEVYQGLSNEYAAIEPPVWSSLIANYLLKKNYDVQILDAEAENLTHDQAAEKILSINPRLAIFMIYGQQPSASTQCMPGGKKTCLKLNDLSSNEIKTIVLGTHASALPRTTLNEEPYDFVCQGEGPITIAKLIDHLKENEIIRAHKHTPKLVTIDITQESLIIIKGLIIVSQYDIDDQIITEYKLKQSDCVITFRGGHKYQVLSTDALVYEHKTGPYLGVDKKMIE